MDNNTQVKIIAGGEEAQAQVWIGTGVDKPQLRNPCTNPHKESDVLAKRAIPVIYQRNTVRRESVLENI